MEPANSWNFVRFLQIMASVTPTQLLVKLIFEKVSNTQIGI